MSERDVSAYLYHPHEQDDQPQSHGPRPFDNPDTNNATLIGWQAQEEHLESQYWPADFLYPNKKGWYRHLDELNRGVKYGPSWYNNRYHVYQLNSTLINLTSEELALNPLQRGRAHNRFLDLSLSELGVPAEHVAICTCAWVVHNDADVDRKCHPNVNTANMDDEFAAILKESDMRWKMFHRIYSRLDRKFGADVPSDREFDRFNRHEFEPATDGKSSDLVDSSDVSDGEDKTEWAWGVATTGYCACWSSCRIAEYTKSLRSRYFGSPATTALISCFDSRLRPFVLINNNSLP